MPIHVAITRRGRPGVSPVARARSVVSFVSQSATAMENGRGDAARCLSNQSADWRHPFASVKEAVAAAELARCFGANRDVSYVVRDAAADPLAQALAQSTP